MAVLKSRRNPIFTRVNHYFTLQQHIVLRIDLRFKYKTQGLFKSTLNCLIQS